MSKKQNSLKIEIKSIKFFMILAGAITIYFNTSFLDPFNSPKMIILMFMASWFTGHTINSYRINGFSLNKDDLRNQIIVFCLLFGFFLSFLSTDIKIIGFLGETQRRNGFISYVSLILIFLYCAKHFNFIATLTLIRFAITIGFVISVYSILQMTGHDFVAWNNPYNSIIATVGNPNFASALMAVLSLISILSLKIKYIQKNYKFIAILTAIFSLIAIFQSQSRQGLIAFGIGFSIYLLLYRIYVRKSFAKLSLLIFFSFSFLLILGMLQKGPLVSLVYKDSVSVRGFYWRAAMRMFVDNPVFGVGLDRYGAYFKEYRESAYSIRYGFGLTSSNAHNTFLQLFATGGLLVGLVYLLLTIYILVTGIKIIKFASEQKQLIILTILSAWVAFQAQSLISIDNIGISIWGWILGGSILGIATLEKQNLKHETNLVGNRSYRNDYSVNLFQPIISGILFIPILIMSIQIVKFENDTYKIRGLALNVSEPNKNLLIKLNSEIFLQRFTDPSYKFYNAMALINVGQQDLAFRQIKQVSDYDPRNQDALEWLAEYSNSVNQKNEAITYREKIRALDKWNAENLLKLGTLYSEINNNKMANDIFSYILTFAGNTNEAKAARDKLK